GTAVACFIVARYAPLHAAEPKTWAVLIGAVSADVIVTVAGVLGVITLLQGLMSMQALMRTAVSSLIPGLVNSVAGVVVLLVLQYSRWAILLLAVLAAVVVAVYRAYATFLRQHKSLAEMYDLTRAIAEHPYDGTIADVLLRGVRELTHAEWA